MTDFPVEYVRPRNINTPKYWNWARKHMRDVTSRSVRVADTVAKRLAKLPPANVQEYGFGHLRLAEAIGPERWHGFDFSPITVKDARAAGYHATIRRCEDAEDPGDAYVVALEVIEHLDHGEMMVFLTAIMGASRAFISVPRMTKRDTRFPQHMRGFGELEDIAQFLGKFWPRVRVESVHPYWRLARCTRPT
jgi:hypothetical protein